MNISLAGVRSDKSGPRAGHHAHAMTKEHTSLSAMTPCPSIFATYSADLAPCETPHQLHDRGARALIPRISQVQPGSQRVGRVLQSSFHWDQHRVVTRTFIRRSTTGR